MDNTNDITAEVEMSEVSVSEVEATMEMPSVPVVEAQMELPVLLEGDHAKLSHLGFEESGHTGFQKQLIAGDNIEIDEHGRIRVAGIERMVYRGTLETLSIPEDSADGDVFKVMSDVLGKQFVGDAYESGIWRVFTKDEITYIINNYGHTFGTIGEQHGLFIIPDNIETALVSGCMEYATNVLTTEQWDTEKSKGVVFLPNVIYGGTRPLQRRGYWTGTALNYRDGACLFWEDTANFSTVQYLKTNDDWRFNSVMSVRLVRDVDSNTPNAFYTGEKHVLFAESNLIYKKDVGFKFADNAYDVFEPLSGDDRENGWIDNFTYSTSGHNGRMPWMKYYDVRFLHYTGNISGTDYDWGTYNRIGVNMDVIWPAGTMFVRQGNTMVPMSCCFLKEEYYQIANIKNKADKADLANYVEKSQTVGLVRNDGSIDTSSYLTEHQDISGKANTLDLAQVAFSGNYSHLTNRPQIPNIQFDYYTTSKYLSKKGTWEDIPQGGGGAGEDVLVIYAFASEEDLSQNTTFDFYLDKSRNDLLKSLEITNNADKKDFVLRCYTKGGVLMFRTSDYVLVYDGKFYTKLIFYVHSWKCERSIEFDIDK